MKWINGQTLEVLNFYCPAVCKIVRKSYRALTLSVPLGETNEEFYQGIYTGQPLPMRPFTNSNPPPLPIRPPVWQPEQSTMANDNDRDGPSWVCTMCTFDNHPLMNKCEECDMPRLLSSAASSSAGMLRTKIASASSLPLSSAMAVAATRNNTPRPPLLPEK